VLSISRYFCKAIISKWRKFNCSRLSSGKP
jgi:hypothetical protein